MSIILGFLCMVVGISFAKICTELKEIVQQLHYIDLELAALRKMRGSENE